MRADSSSSTRKPIETTFSNPSPMGFWWGTIFFSSSAPWRRPSIPSMRGTE